MCGVACAEAVSWRGRRRRRCSGLAELGGASSLCARRRRRLCGRWQRAGVRGPSGVGGGDLRAPRKVLVCNQESESEVASRVRHLGAKVPRAGGSLRARELRAARSTRAERRPFPPPRLFLPLSASLFFPRACTRIPHDSVATGGPPVRKPRRGGPWYGNLGAVFKGCHW